MSDQTYNSNGDDISQVKIRLLKDEYGYVDENNIPHIDWGKESNKCDKDGFLQEKITWRL